MSLNDRVFGAFENELVRHLSFTFTIVRRVDRQGKPISQFRVWMRNDSTILLKDVRGSISPGPAAEFRFATFYLETLAPRKQAEIARIDAKILEPTHNRFAYDRMAQVNVSGRPDLSTFRFKDTGRNLSYVSGHTPVADLDLPGTREVEPRGRTSNPSTLQLDWSKVSGKKPA